PGIIGGAMLGLGRALGETMAVAMILSPSLVISWFLLQSGNQTIAAHIALQYPEATGYGVSALIAAGLVLFAITLAVNMVARFVVSRRKEFA
ncbi:MAG: phosphate ABC transporter permease subunit PstC, partial [Thermobifida fusca]|nr:phosphate ABC transporter permease subunit PstC [Thermobifida fusca]